MILVRSPEPLAEMLDYGYTFDHVTVGNMSTKMVLNRFVTICL